jgi:hypothetical protein
MPPPGILSGVPFRRRALPTHEATRPSRFVTQSHALSAPIASPRSMFIALTVAIALYLIGRRLSD